MTVKRLGLYLGVAPDAGGMFQYAQCVLQAVGAMHSDQLEVIVAYGNDDWKPIIDRLSLKGVRLQHWRFGEVVAKIVMGAFLPANAARAVAALMNPLAAELSKLSCDVWIFPAQDVLSWQLRTPAIATIHDLMHRYERSFPEAGSWWRYLLREHRFRNLANATAAVLVDSKVGQNQVVESYGVSPERIYPLPYIAPTYIYSSCERPDLSDYYRLPKKFFFYPAQFWPHKNHLRLVEALANARSSCPDMTLVLTGGAAHDYLKVRERIFALGLDRAVHFLGYVPDSDLAGLYRRARGLIMPTFFGPTNIPPLEAMVCGCPVLISGIYGIPEQCGDAAIYFSPGSVDEMQRAMVSLWSDDRLYSQLAKKGAEKAASWQVADFNRCLRDITYHVLSQLQSSDFLPRDK